MARRLADGLCGVFWGIKAVSFRRQVSINNHHHESSILRTAVVVLFLATVGSLCAILVRSGAAAQADVSIVDLRKSLP
jgi:hypothetical protein